LIPSLCVSSGEELPVFIMVPQSSSLNALTWAECHRQVGPRGDAEAAETAEISERSLIAAAERLGVRSQRDQWWQPG
jgi:hypothetical protein